MSLTLLSLSGDSEDARGRIEMARMELLVVAVSLVLVRLLVFVFATRPEVNDKVLF